MDNIIPSTAFVVLMVAPLLSYSDSTAPVPEAECRNMPEPSLHDPEYRVKVQAWNYCTTNGLTPNSRKSVPQRETERKKSLDDFDFHDMAIPELARELREVLDLVNNRRRNLTQLEQSIAQREQNGKWSTTTDISPINACSLNQTIRS